MITKQEARTEVFKQRKELLVQECTELSTVICKKVQNIPEIHKTTTILLYSAIRNEVLTEDLYSYALNKGITVAFPRVNGDTMEFYEINKDSELIKGYMGIREPDNNCELIIPTEGVIIVPGVAFDEKFGRAGYGKGFYDRYLSRHTNLTKIGICFDFQLYDNIQTDDKDILMDYIVTPTKTFRRI